MEIREREPSKWLTKASGYLEGYSHTLNPYAGCSFGCSYCYVRQMPVGLFRGEPWGSWVDVKRFDADHFRKEWLRELGKGPVTVFMSSATDPYQPMEYEKKITRSLLETMAEQPPDFLLVQTRSPLVTRDIDLLLALGAHVRVSMTVETDLEPMRKALTPSAPPLAARFAAMEQLQEAGIAVQAAVSPLLPCSEQFAGKLLAAAPRIVVDDYFRGDGSGGKRTGRLAVRETYESLGMGDFYRPAYADEFYERLSAAAPPSIVYFGQAGFLP
ncbi:SPL family radical SAM protein [Paenibacillus protaetiae]|uniref:Radical SAM protein n=1 Tax=Paenibacillus protaetiae TaxID=2509456 RepID=A0A4P6ER29_9BACL|nr:radical SAM protein [Paenibacillus protaetiae]QAY65450.1 radical SAM protein [Paenibacillus protaetiae]